MSHLLHRIPPSAKCLSRIPPRSPRRLQLVAYSPSHVSISGNRLALESSKPTLVENSIHVRLRYVLMLSAHHSMPAARESMLGLRRRGKFGTARRFRRRHPSAEARPGTVSQERCVGSTDTAPRSSSPPSTTPSFSPCGCPAYLLLPSEPSTTRSCTFSPTPTSTARSSTQQTRRRRVHQEASALRKLRTRAGAPSMAKKAGSEHCAVLFVATERVHAS